MATAVVSESVSDELAESKRRIEELAAALDAERERAASAEAALRGGDANGGDQAAALHHPAGAAAGANTDEAPWAGRVVDARMFMSLHSPPRVALLGKTLDFSRLPSVVTWLQPYNKPSLPVCSSRHATYTQSPQTPRVASVTAHTVQINVEELRELREHDGNIWCCALHPQVPLIATGSSDTTVRLWRLDGESLRVLRGHTEWVYTVAFDPLGEILCSGAFDGSIRLWHVGTGECVRIIRRQNVSFHSVAFQPRMGAYLAAASSEPVVRLYRVEDGEIARTLAGHGGAVTCVAFQPPEGLLLATASVDCTLRLWHTVDGSCVHVLGQRSKAKVWCCAFDSSGLVVASGGSDCVVRVWRVADGSMLAALSGHKGAVRSVVFHPLLSCVLASGEGNLTWGSDNSVRLWFVGDDPCALLAAAKSEALDMVAGGCKAVLLGHTRMITALSLAPDGCVLVSVSRDASARLWQLSVVGDRGQLLDASLPLNLGEARGVEEANGMSAQEAVVAAEMAREGCVGTQSEEKEVDHGLRQAAAGVQPAQWVRRVAGESGMAAATELQNQVEALSSKIKIVTSRTLGGDTELRKMSQKMSKLWRGSLISDEELAVGLTLRSLLLLNVCYIRRISHVVQFFPP